MLQRAWLKMVFISRSAEFFQKLRNKEELVVYTVIEKCNVPHMRGDTNYQNTTKLLLLFEKCVCFS
jgi:hypothetical protein